MTPWIHELTDWPDFRWDAARLEEPLGAVRYAQGHLTGRMASLGLGVRQETVLATLTEDVLTSSSIEGETLDAEQVRSSLARRLGLDIGGMRPVDRNVEGVVEMMLDATRHYAEMITVGRLLVWHASLFPTGRSAMRRIVVGAWRDDLDGPMQVVSGPVNREHVHFEAPPAGRIGREAQAFLDWFNSNGETDWLLKAGVAHLWFVTIHPFEDGNGRIARAIADLALARSEQSPQRFYSMSAQIQNERDAYYGILERTQRGTMDITAWLDWFLGCLGRAIEGARNSLADTLRRARFWASLGPEALNPRQRLVLSRLLDGFQGKLTTAKWAKLAKCSGDTALRDIQALMARGILVRGQEGGRSTSYELVLPPD